MSEPVLRKVEFWNRHTQTHLNERQTTVLNRILDGFEGKLTAKNWAVIGKCSIPTAQRDINEMVVRGALQRNPGGSRNTRHDLLLAP